MATEIKGLFIIEPQIFEDGRGFFLESYNYNTFKEIGIENIFVQDNHSKSLKGVLRGLHFQKEEYSQAKLVRVLKGAVLDIVVDLRKNSEFDDFSIGGAFYPETHYENNDLIDLFHLKNKVEAGTDFLTSQMFFDNDIFIKFKEKAEKLDIKVPLVAGIMPVTNAKQIKRIIELSKCSVPQKLDKLLEKYGDNPESMKKAGIMYASEQIIELLAYGIKGIHIYTMNKPEIAKEIMKNIEFAR